MVSDSRPKGLIIDNSPETAAHTRDILAAVKIDVLEWVRNGTAWIEVFKNKRFDLVVVDYVLPKRDGIFVTEKIIELDPPCAVIFMHPFEGWTANVIEVKAFSAGAGACFSRPVSDKRFALMAERLASQSVKKRPSTKVKLVSPK